MDEYNGSRHPLAFVRGMSGWQGTEGVRNPKGYCFCIMTRGGKYGEIYPESEGFSKGSGYISPYILTKKEKCKFNTTII